MRGRLGYDKWLVSDDGSGRFFIAERIVDGQLEHRYFSSHCLACAKSDVIAKYGGKVDTRGWHRQGLCGVFLLAMIKGNEAR